MILYLLMGGKEQGGWVNSPILQKENYESVSPVGNTYCVCSDKGTLRIMASIMYF